MSAVTVLTGDEYVAVNGWPIRAVIDDENNYELYFQKSKSSIIEEHHELEHSQKTILAILVDAKKNAIAPSQRLSLLIQLRDFLPLLERGQYLSEEKNRFTKTIKSLTELAYLLCDWSLLIFIRTRLSAYWVYQASQERIELSFSLSTAYQHVGRYDLAEQSLASALLIYPSHSGLHNTWYSLKEENLQQQTYHHDNEISLTPLTSEHLHDFAWQYSEPIKELCNLPLFVENDDWHYWYQDMQADPNRYLFAVIHQEWGFIGCVNLQVFNGTGFFYYWFGDDFQGCGFGPRAVNLLMDFGYHEHGMHCCYAKVYTHNLPSHKAINKLGFKKLPFTAIHPDENEVFYYWGGLKPDHQLFTELTILLKNIGSSLQPVPHKEMFNTNNDTSILSEALR
ncbi:MAG: RimJ/RimL family protein N-acetyltransferase [Candidatus Endobugula sp.]|jgi:RimJ/RimL family protein N-acetyltransferase